MTIYIVAVCIIAVIMMLGAYAEGYNNGYDEGDKYNGSTHYRDGYNQARLDMMEWYKQKGEKF